MTLESKKRISPDLGRFFKRARNARFKLIYAIYSFLNEYMIYLGILRRKKFYVFKIFGLLNTSSQEEINKTWYFVPSFCPFELPKSSITLSAFDIFNKLNTFEPFEAVSSPNSILLLTKSDAIKSTLRKKSPKNVRSTRIILEQWI